MCIAAWLWQAHPLYPLILLLNRDELHGRPTKPVGWWVWGSKKILGGMDVQGGGTWMGCTRDGRLAFLTNVLEPHNIPFAKTRGDLPARFSESSESPVEFAEDISREADQYNGFNLIVADLCSKTMVYISNRPNGEAAKIEIVSHGLHVLTNGKLDSPWPKAQQLAQNLKNYLNKFHEDEELPSAKMVQQLLTDRKKASKDMLPNTGCDSDWEQKLSSIFVEFETELGLYGTRSQAALLVKSSGEVSLYERYLEDNVWKDHIVEYNIEKAQKKYAIDSN